MADNKKKNRGFNIKNFMTNSKAMNDKLSYLASDNPIQDNDIEDMLSSFDTDVLKNLKQIEQDTGGYVSLLVQKIASESKSPEVKNTLSNLSDLFKSKDIDFISYLYQNEKTNLQYYVDFEPLMLFIPDLKVALNDRKSAIISPDDFTLGVSDYIKYEGEKKENIKETTERIEDKYNVEDKFEKMIDISLKRGKSYLFVKPYEDIFKEILNDKNNKETSIRNIPIKESMFLDPNVKTNLHESVNYNFNEITGLMENIGVIVDDIPKRNREPFTETYNDLCKTFIENVSIYKDNTTQTLIETIQVKTRFAKNRSDKRMLSDMIQTAVQDGLKELDRDAKSPRASFMADAEPTIKEIGLDGCYVEVIEPQRIIPVQINNEVLGYFYIESSDEIDRLNSISNNLSGFMSGSTKINNKEKSPADAVFRTLSDLVVQKLDKDFILKNRDIQDQIYNLIRYNESFNKKFKISFIDKSYMHELTINDGKGMFHYSLVLSKVYISIILTHIMLKITRSFDEVMYFVRGSKVDSDMEGIVNSAIRSIEKKNFDFRDILSGSIGKIFKLGSSSLNKHFIPIGTNDQRPFEMEVMSGQDTSINDSFLEDLLTLIRNSTDVPAVLLNFANEADFAKTLVMANSKYVRLIMKDQKSCNKVLTKAYRDIVRHNINQDSEIKPEFFSVKFPTPKNLINTLMTDTLSLYDNYVTNLVKIQYGDNSNDENIGKKKDLLYKELMRDFVQTMEWSKIDEMAKRVEMMLVGQSIENMDDKGNSDEEGSDIVTDKI